MNATENHSFLKPSPLLSHRQSRLWHFFSPCFENENSEDLRLFFSDIHPITYLEWQITVTKNLIYNGRLGVQGLEMLRCFENLQDDILANLNTNIKNLEERAYHIETENIDAGTISRHTFIGEWIRKQQIKNLEIFPHIKSVCQKENCNRCGRRRTLERMTNSLSLSDLNRPELPRPLPC